MGTLRLNLGVREEGEFNLLVGDAFGEAVDCNRQLLKKKARALGFAIGSLAAEVILLAALAFVSL